MPRTATLYERRKGTIFTAHFVDLPKEVTMVHLFLGELEENQHVGSIELSGCFSEYTSSFTPLTDRESLLDRAFQCWLRSDLPDKMIANPVLRAGLKAALQERFDGVPWYKLTLRFLPVERSTWKNPCFILTDDKSDIPEQFKHLETETVTSE